MTTKKSERKSDRGGAIPTPMLGAAEQPLLFPLADCANSTDVIDSCDCETCYVEAFNDGYGYDLLQNEGSRHYERVPFPDDLSGDYNLNGNLTEDNLGEGLDELADATYGGDGCGCCFEITGDIPDCDERIRIKINDDERLEIQDITDRILELSNDTRFFILVNRELTEYKWVIADPKGTVYSG